MFCLKKNYRLHNFKIIKHIQERGILIYKTFCIISKILIIKREVGIHKNLSDVAILITVHKKKFKKAVDRNLIKRRIREIFRLNKHNINSYEGYIICINFIYISSFIIKFDELRNEILNAFAEINRYTENNINI